MDTHNATISKETFQSLVLLYLIGQFPEGIFSSFRLQKVLYFATRSAELKPFTFPTIRSTDNTAVTPLPCSP